MKDVTQPRSAGSSTDPSYEEKNVSHVVERYAESSTLGLPEDPDAHLSDAEKAEIVSHQY